MKIMYIVDQFNTHGGIEKILSSKINSLIEDYGHSVFLVTSGQQGQPFVYNLNSGLVHIDLGIDYKEGESFFSRSALSKKIKHRKSLIKTIDRINPDIIVSPAFSHDQYFLPFIRRRIPKIKEIHFSGIIMPPRYGKPSAMSLVRIFFPLFNRVVILNEDEKQYFPGFRLSVIPNFVDCELPNPEFILKKEKTVMAAGRIAPVKQFDHLLKAWAKIEKEFPDWTLKIFGEGESEYVAGLKKLGLDLGLKSAIFPGSVNNLSELMREASVFVLSSANECFPMVLLEAKCAGLPAVSYDSPNGPRNIIKHNEDGFLVKNGSVEELANSLLNIINDNHLRSKMAGHALQGAGEFSKMKIMKKWSDLFTELRS